MAASLSTSASLPKVKTTRESVLFGYDFTSLLVAGEALTGTPTLSISPAGLTFGGPVVNVASFLNDSGQTVPIGAGVQIRISGGTDQTDYAHTVQCGTSAGNTREIACTLQVRDS